MSRFEVSLTRRRESFQFNAQFSVDLRGIVGIFGASGSGKTTLLRCIAGFERAHGDVRFGDLTWQDDARNRFVPPWERGAAVVFQDARLFPHLDVKHNLRFGSNGARRDVPAVEWTRVVDALQLGGLLDRPVAGLSGGERQRVAIGRALLAHPRVVLMDEPLASVDDKRKRDILPLIRAVADEFAIPILLVSHAIQELIQVGDQLLVMDGGSVVTHGAINAVLANLHEFDYDGDHTGCVLATRVTGHDARYDLSVVDFNGQQLFVSRHDVPIGGTLRVFVLSRNVSVATQPIESGFSVLNVLEGRITQIRDVKRGASVVDVVIDVGAPLVATITRKSLDQLSLSVGQRVFAYIKAVSL